jgi:hypothetical protein
MSFVKKKPGPDPGNLKSQPEKSGTKGGHGLPGFFPVANHDRLNQKLLRGVQGGGFLEKSPPGRRRHLADAIPSLTIESFFFRIVNAA